MAFKAVIVSLATIAKHGGRLDAGYYCGLSGAEAHKAKVAKARKDVKDSKARLVKYRAEQKEEEVRLKGMEERGEIIPVKPKRRTRAKRISST